MLTDANTAFEVEKKKNKNKKGYVAVPPDPDKFIPKLGDELVYKAFKLRLNLSDC